MATDKVSERIEMLDAEPIHDEHEGFVAFVPHRGAAFSSLALETKIDIVAKQTGLTRKHLFKRHKQSFDEFVYENYPTHYFVVANYASLLAAQQRGVQEVIQEYEWSLLTDAPSEFANFALEAYKSQADSIHASEIGLARDFRYVDTKHTKRSSPVVSLSGYRERVAAHYTNALITSTFTPLLFCRLHQLGLNDSLTELASMGLGPGKASNFIYPGNLEWCSDWGYANEDGDIPNRIAYRFLKNTIPGLLHHFSDPELQRLVYFEVRHRGIFLSL